MSIIGQIEEMLELLYDTLAVRREDLEIHMGPETLIMLRMEVKRLGITLLPATGPLQPQYERIPIVLNEKAPKGKIYILQREPIQEAPPERDG
jgi:hypothetical protein